MKEPEKLYLGGNQPTSPRLRLLNCKRRCPSVQSTTATRRTNPLSYSLLPSPNSIYTSAGEV